MAVSLAISDIFSVKGWHDLEIGGHRKWCRSTFYWSAIVTIALPCTIFELFGVE